MAAENRGPFRQKSLERLSSPERLDQLLSIVDRKSWLPLTALGLLVTAVVVWSIVGRIPVTVQGHGILVYPRNVVEVQPHGEGRLTDIDLAVGDHVEAGDVIGRVEQPGLAKQLELLRAKMEQLTALAQATEILELTASEPGGADEEVGVEGHIRTSQSNAERLYESAIAALDDEREILARQLVHAEDQVESRRRAYERHLELHQAEILSEQDVVEAWNQYLDSQARRAAIETRRVELSTRELEINDQYMSRLQRLADLRLELQGHEQQIAETRREIARVEQRLTTEGSIVAERSGTVIEVNAIPGQHVQRGDRLAAINADGHELDLLSVTYFTVRDGKRLEQGQPIQVTPDTVERERFGGIVGEVTRVSQLPVSLAEAQAVIGNREIAESLVTGGYRMQVYARLDRDADAPGRFRWSSSRGPEDEISVGTTTTARVTVDNRSPISFVLPSLKKSAGID
jgi:HlyD family secretion protein